MTVPAKAIAAEAGVLPRISVCVCTYRRPEWLRRLLGYLVCQETEGRFTFEIVVADNDRLRSGEPAVRETSAGSLKQIIYTVEPEQNIALARNRALAEAEGDFIAFIDDDEIPPPDWLITLYSACVSRNVDGALGPVNPLFEEPPARWVVDGKFYERPTHDTGQVLYWTNCRTGNVLFRRSILPADEPPFRSEFGSGGEDRDFFRRMQARGRVFIWCNEAAVHELIPRSRWDRRFLIRRALLRGKASLASKEGLAAKLAVSLLAIPTYAISLPFLYLAGDHLFMKSLIRLCDHVGRVTAAMGLNLVSEIYITR